jgi:hypothetical protein
VIHEGVVLRGVQQLQQGGGGVALVTFAELVCRQVQTDTETDTELETEADTETDRHSTETDKG